MGEVIADGKQEDPVEERLLRMEKMLQKLLAAVRVVVAAVRVVFVVVVGFVVNIYHHFCCFELFKKV